MKKGHSLLIAVAVSAALAGVGVSRAQKASTVQRETLLTTLSAQPPNAPGMTITTVIAEYKPGTETPSHRHGNAFAMVYILEGTIVSKIDDNKEVVLHAGDHFTEAPNAHHVTFKNPSMTDTAKVLATFYAPSDEAVRDLTILDAK